MANDFLQQINSFIASIKEKFKPNRELMVKISEEMHASVMNEFHTEGAGSGGWAPLKPATIKQKRRRNFSDAILQGRGDLVRSIQKTATDTESIVHTNKPQAAILNFGGTIYQGARSETFLRNRYMRGKKKGRFKKGKMEGGQGEYFAGQTFSERIIRIPPRPFMVLTENYSNNILNIIRRHVNST